MLKEYCNCKDDRIIIGKKRPTIMVVDAFEKPENKVKTFFNDVKDYVMSGGAIGQAFDKFGKPIQKKMMTYSLEKRIDKISNKKDFHPGAYGYKIQDLQKAIHYLENELHHEENLLIGKREGIPIQVRTEE